MLYGIVCETDDKKEHRLVFASEVVSLHFRAGRSFSKGDFKDMLEHVDADCKMFRGNAKTSHCKDNIYDPPKNGPRFILSRHMDRKRHEMEKKEYRIDLNEVNRKNGKTIDNILDSDCESIRIVQSYSLPTSDSLEEFYGKKRDKAQKKAENESMNGKVMNSRDMRNGGADNPLKDIETAFRKIYGKLKTINQKKN